MYFNLNYPNFFQFEIIKFLLVFFSFLCNVLNEVEVLWKL